MEKQLLLQKTMFTKWVMEHNGYDYYIGTFDKLFQEMKFKIFEQEAYVIYREYVILQFHIYKKQLYLVDGNNSFFDNTNSIIQRKLHHEYVEYFELSSAPYRVLQLNIIGVQKYVCKVKSKIDAGFKRYSALLTENKLFVENTGFLRIEVDNAFSISELNSLLEAYNQLYSIVACIWEDGYEEISQKNIIDLKEAHNMILESINIGSKGDIFTAGKDIICTLVEALVSAALESDRREYERKKAELELEITSNQLFMQKREDVFRLITMLDYYMNQKSNSLNVRTLPYIENEIMIIIEKIEKLQGSNHINVVA